MTASVRRDTCLHSELARSRIRTGLLLKRLQEHALGKNKMGFTQLRAIEILLRKTVPDLSSVDLTARGDKNNPLHLNLTGSDVHG